MLREVLSASAAIVAFAAFAHAQDCDGWSPIGDPGWRSDIASAFDPVRGVVVMFGGGRRVQQSSGAHHFSETWEFDGRRWTLVPTETSPPRRLAAVSAYEPVSGRVVVHGGQAVAPGSLDTWAYDGTNWSLIATGGPSVTYMFGTLTRDPAVSGALLLTHQQNSAPMRMWRLAGGVWTEIPTTSEQPWPGANVGALGAYDPLRQRLVLFAYATGSVWEWDGATWTEITGAFPPTTAFTISAVTSAPALGGVMFAQGGGTKVWNGSTFTQVGAATLPNGYSLSSLRGVSLADGSPALLGDFVSAAFSSGLSAATVQVLKIGASSSQVIGSRVTPPSRAMASLADYPGRGTVLVGGARDISGNCPTGTPGATYLGDTWLLRGERWTRLATGGVGTPYNAPLVYDPAEGTMVFPTHCSIRAGAVGAGGTVRSARWNAAAGGWESWTFPTNPTPVPSGYNSNAVDPATGRVWVAMQQAAGLYLRNGMTWSSVTTGGSVQLYGTITFDPVRNAVVKVGNNAGGEATSAYNVGTGLWSQIQAYPSNQNTPYPGRWGPASVYDPGRQAMVVFGGFNTTDNATTGSFPNSTYLLPSTATAWQRLSTPNMPGREYYNLAYDPVGERVVTFGGHNFDYLGDTWKLARGPARVAVPPAAVTVDAGGTATFEVIAKGGGVIRYQWRRNGQPLTDDDRHDGVHTDLLTVTGLLGSDADDYDVVVTNPCGTDTSAAAHLTVTGAICLADIGSTGGTAGPDGELNNNDFVVFIDWFFAADPRADVGGTGGVPGSDGAWDNNDFVVFIDRFFTPC